ncbi:lysM domain receptor-like kinase 3 [Coffea eugenioides]|uniref:lysM domain receptor-like kinase 3 n=1 Tax=Coffea eugenioides TaxID=49369 RepID=UPI000F60EE5C|nr:lysM domain receptor-like kinase 3 [Coffea eugenioides]
MLFFIKPRIITALLLFLVVSISLQTCQVNSQCSKGCDLALASYNVWQNLNPTIIAQLFSVPTSTLITWNPVSIPDEDTVLEGTRVNIPFPCDCINGNLLAHVFNCSVSSGDTYDIIASHFYANLTSTTWLRRFNSYPENNIPDTGVLNVTVNCSCGNKAISKDYGLFITWPIEVGDTLESVAAANNLSADLISRYNPTANFTAGSGLLFIPAKDLSGNYRLLRQGGSIFSYWFILPLLMSNYRMYLRIDVGIFDILGFATLGSGLSGGAISGISLAVVGVFFFAACGYLLVYRKRKAEKISLKDQFEQPASDTAAKAPESVNDAKRASSGLGGVVVERSFEFSYEELAIATKGFSLANKIGEGGFGSVYYAELGGEKAAIKKMDLKAKREFVAELRVLTHVHHQNLVRLIGYCVKGSLFLVYEYIDNGNLSQHLRGSGCDTLSWSSRVQIAVDSARGLEYIHEHTIPAYIHRDIKSANILIDKDFRAKVADFGLAKLAEVGGSSLQSHLVGTFGYMAPEYANCGTVSPKVDVYAFGVMLYELISAKAAVVDGGSTTDTKGLVGLFEQVPIIPDSNDDLRKLVDPRLGDNYPIESVSKMFQLAKLCTHKKPESRPSMRSVIVALMALSSPTKDSKIFVPHLETEILKYEYSMIKSMETEVLGSETFTVTSVESEAYTIEEGIED